MYHLPHTFIAFPKSSESSMTAGGLSTTSTSSDPDSELVKKRKLDIQTFLRNLFAVFPSLLEHTAAVDFLQLSAFSPDVHVRISSTRAFSRPSSPILTPTSPLCEIANLPPPSSYFESPKSNCSAGSMSVAHLLPGSKSIPPAGKASPCYGSFYAATGGR
jgi:hypothetical protein